MKKTISLVLVLTLCMVAEVTKADFVFGEPMNLGPPVNSSYRECDPSLSADGLELYFNCIRAGGSGGMDLWVAKRASVDEDWEQPENLGPTVNCQRSNS